MSQIWKTLAAGGVGPIDTISGNDGIPEAPIGNNFTIQTANATPKFLGSAGTETLDFALPVNLNLGSSMMAVTSGTSNAGYGPGVFGLLTSGTNNNSFGFLSGQSITTGQSNSLFGFGSGRFITTGMSNSYFGSGSGSNTTVSQNNSGFGQGALGGFITGPGNTGGNTAVGSVVLDQLKTGTGNIGIGFNAGHNYLTSESNNIVIGNAGVNYSLISTAGESNVIRIGTAGIQLQTFLTGILFTNSGRVVNITSPGVFPYTTLTTDDTIFIDTSGGAHTVNLFASPALGTRYVIKDITANAGINNITISGNGKSIVGSTSAATYVISANGGSATLIYNGTVWGVV